MLSRCPWLPSAAAPAPFDSARLPLHRSKTIKFLTGSCRNGEILPRFMQLKSESNQVRRKCYPCMSTTGEIQPSVTSIIPEPESLVFSAINMNFFERLGLAWKILFPASAVRTSTMNSNASIAKQRLKMILFSDRCAVTEEAKQKIVSNIVQALSDFVEIDSHDKVQLSVSADPDLGTVYSVTVPVKRVKPQYQEGDEEYTGIANVEYKERGETSGSVDVKFEFFLPSDK